MTTINTTENTYRKGSRCSNLPLGLFQINVVFLVVVFLICTSLIDSYTCAPTTLTHPTQQCRIHETKNRLEPLFASTSTPSTTTRPQAKPQTGIAQWLLDRALESPLWKLLLVPQAKATMTKTAEANGIPWMKAREWIQQADGPWKATSDEKQGNVLSVEAYPEYYRREFHAYDNGNLSWKAAFEQEIASRAVGARNFPTYKEKGEDAFRGAFDYALTSLGANVPDQGIIVDLGCGTGASTRRLAARWTNAKHIIGMDLSPYFIEVGRKLLELQPKSFGEGGRWVTTILSDPRINLRVGNAADTALPDNFADVVNLQFILHELPLSATKKVCNEALRILKPGGQLWICEMDFDSPAYAAQRSNALLFSLLRSTEPYLDEYADGMAETREFLAQKFASVKTEAATGRHYALIATKSSTMDTELQSPAVIEDRRFKADGSYAIEDTHLKLWESKQ